MITIKKLTIFEQNILRYKTDHPIKFIAIILCIVSILLILNGSIAIIVYNSDGMGTFIVGDWYFGTSTIDLQLYNIELELCLEHILEFILLSILTIFLYIKIKDLLIYKNENL